MTPTCLVIAIVCRIWEPGGDCKPERDAAPAWLERCYADEPWTGRQRTVNEMLRDCQLSIRGERELWRRMGALAGRVECMEAPKMEQNNANAADAARKELAVIVRGIIPKVPKANP